MTVARPREGVGNFMQQRGPQLALIVERDKVARNGYLAAPEVTAATALACVVQAE